MAQTEHPWIEGCDQYEAVLVCTNDLRAWEPVQTLRAYQTYQFSDSSISGEDPSFTHNDTGAIIRHEGNVLAIDYGHGKMHDMLPDLFYVLNNLGWKGAEVYHPAETMSELLADIGRAIPANMDFDVKAAQMGTPIEENPVAANLMAHAAKLMSGRGNANDEIFSEMQNMDASIAGAGRDAFVPPVMASAAGPIVLADDDEGFEEDLVMSGVGTRLDYNEQPTVFLVPDDDDGGIYAGAAAADAPLPFRKAAEGQEGGFAGLQGDGRAALEVARAAEEANARVMAEQAAALALADAERRRADEAAAAARVICEPFTATKTLQAIATAEAAARAKVAERVLLDAAAAPVVVKQNQDQVPAATAADVLDEARVGQGNIVAVGRSVFCFDLPSSPLSADDLAAIAAERCVADNQVVHICPGVLGEKVRWDVLGEIAPESEFPWVAERLVAAMGLPAADVPLVACVLLALKKHKVYAELRDVLLFAGPSFESVLDTVFNVSPFYADVLRQYTNSYNDSPRVKCLMNSIVERFGALSLSPAGQSFVDLRLGAEDLADTMQEMITVREVVKSPVSRMFVVHVDEIDGPFVVWLANSLHAVAAMYSRSKRALPVVEIEPAVVETVESKPLVAAEVNALVGGLVEQLRKLGVAV